MKLLCRFVAFIVFASANFISSQHLLAQTADVTATIQFSNGQSLSIVDLSDLIGIQPSEVVSVTIQLALQDIGHAFGIEAFDGGRVLSRGIVAEDGTISFTFGAPANAGLDRIAIRGVSKTLRMQFWVLDAANPQNNPPVITPANPEN
jgi:hypothetical protein